MTRFAPTILAVDDEYASLEVLALLLEGEGFRVLTASDGEEAFACLEVEKVDLVITDYMMPKLNGAELAAQMRDDPRFAQLPIVMVTASFKVESALPTRVVEVVPKPILFDKLLAAVRRAIEAAPPSR